KGVGSILRAGRIGGVGRERPKKTEPDTLLTAEWLQYEIRVPGQTSQKFRRQVFDLLGPAQRSKGKVPMPTITREQQLHRGLSLMGQTDILPVVCHLTPQYVQHVAIQNLLVNGSVLRHELVKTNRMDFKMMTS